MPDNDACAAKVARKVGNDDVCARKIVTSIDKIRDQRGNAALESVAEKCDDPYLQAEFPTHIHRPGISAADFRDVFMLKACDKFRKIETADEIAHDGNNQELIPILRKRPLFHRYSPLVSFIPLLSFRGRLS